MLGSEKCSLEIVRMIKPYKNYFTHQVYWERKIKQITIFLTRLADFRMRTNSELYRLDIIFIEKVYPDEHLLISEQN